MIIILVCFGKKGTNHPKFSFLLYLCYAFLVFRLYIFFTSVDAFIACKEGFYFFVFGLGLAGPEHGGKGKEFLHAKKIIMSKILDIRIANFRHYSVLTIFKDWSVYIASILALSASTKTK